MCAFRTSMCANRNHVEFPFQGGVANFKNQKTYLRKLVLRIASADVKYRLKDGSSHVHLHEKTFREKGITELYVKAPEFKNKTYGVVELWIGEREEWHLVLKIKLDKSFRKQRPPVFIKPIPIEPILLIDAAAYTYPEGEEDATYSQIIAPLSPLSGEWTLPNLDPQPEPFQWVLGLCEGDLGGEFL